VGPSTSALIGVSISGCMGGVAHSQPGTSAAAPKRAPPMGAKSGTRGRGVKRFIPRA
jgi:hypothetical protein